MASERRRQIEVLYEKGASGVSLAAAQICGARLRACLRRRRLRPRNRFRLAREADALTQLGPYKIDAKLGEGGMGEVFRATDTRLHRTVAIKMLRGQDSTDPSARDRFQREARAASALNHPNICTVHDIGEADGQPYLVMECLERGNASGEAAAWKAPCFQSCWILVCRWRTRSTQRIRMVHRPPRHPARESLRHQAGASKGDGFRPGKGELGDR